MNEQPSQSWLDPYVPKVARWCARLGGPWVEAEDAAQDVLMVALRGRDQLRDPAVVESWLFGITRRVLATHRRRAWWKRTVALVGREPHDPRLGPDDSADVARRVQQVLAWLELLPRGQREVVVLCLVEERSTAEAAALIGVAQGTVKSRLRLARARLAQLADEAS